MNPINFAIDFVATSTGASVENIGVSSGVVASICSLAVVLVVATVFFVVQRRKAVMYGNYGSANASSQKKVFSSFSAKLICVAVGVLLAIFAIGMLVQNQAFASADDDDEPFVNRITATVDTENGTVSIPAFNLKNTDGFAYRLASASVAVSDEATDIAALSNAKLTINGFGGSIFSDAPNGAAHETMNLADLETNEETELTFDIANLDKETALALCGKTGFTFSLIPSAVCKLDMNSEEDAISKLNSVTPPTKAGYTFESWNTKEDGTGINVSAETPEATLDNGTGALNLYPLYSENADYTVNYETFGGPAIVPLTNVAWEQTGLLPSLDPTRDGYNFNGWYYGKLKKQKATNNTTYGEIAGTEKESVTLYASWTPQYFTVTCNLSGVTCSNPPAGWRNSESSYTKQFFSGMPKKDIVKEWKDASLTIPDGFTSEGWPEQADETLSSDWSFEPRVTGLNYQVCVWGINEDAYDSEETHTNGLTFGPAIGSNSSCLDVNGSHEHCIHNDTWDTIIQNASKNPDCYKSCLEYGCTKSVPIFINTTLVGNSSILEKAVRCSILYYSIKDTYKKWNDSYNNNDCESANYATSRMRATLIGMDNMGTEHQPSQYAGGNLLDSTNCLLSCFPKVLQDNIKLKYMEVATTWETSSSTTPPYKINTSTFITDKLWLMNMNETYGNPMSSFKDYRNQYNKASKIGISADNFKSNKGYTDMNTIANTRWFRTPYRLYRYLAGYVITDGSYGYGTVDSKTNVPGLSPCFCL